MCKFIKFSDPRSFVIREDQILYAYIDVKVGGRTRLTIVTADGSNIPLDYGYEEDNARSDLNRICGDITNSDLSSSVVAVPLDNYNE